MPLFEIWWCMWKSGGSSRATIYFPLFFINLLILYWSWVTYGRFLNLISLFFLFKFSLVNEDFFVKMLWSLDCTKLTICRNFCVYMSVAKCIFHLPSCRLPSTTDWLDKRCWYFLTVAFSYTLCWRWFQWCCNCRRACWSSDGVHWIVLLFFPLPYFQLHLAIIWLSLFIYVSAFLQNFNCKFS